MKAYATLGTAVLFLSFGTIGPAFAQQQQDEAKQEAKQEPKQEQKQPQQHAQPKNQQKQPQQAEQQGQQKQQAERQKQPQQAQQQHAQSQDQQKQPQQQQAQRQGGQEPPQHTQQQQSVQQAAWQQHRSQNWQSDHRTWQQRGGYNGYRIPDNRYNGYFGQSHAFVIYGQPYMVVGGFPRFQYGGFWFSLVDPWPGDWSNNWYETDDVYVVYENNGYYMYNQRYPGVGIAISVSM